MAIAPNFGADNGAKTLWNDAIGVRTPATMNTSFSWVVEVPFVEMGLAAAFKKGNQF